MRASVTSSGGPARRQTPRALSPPPSRARNGTGRGAHSPSGPRKAARSVNSHTMYTSHGPPARARGVTSIATGSPASTVVGVALSENGAAGSAASADVAASMSTAASTTAARRRAMSNAPTMSPNTSLYAGVAASTETFRAYCFHRGPWARTAASSPTRRTRGRSHVRGVSCHEGCARRRELTIERNFQ